METMVMNTANSKTKHSNKFIYNFTLVLIHCNVVNNSYQQASKALFKFVPNKKYG